MDRIQPSSLVYIDTNIFIYFVEGITPLFDKAKDVFERMDNIGAKALTSEITLAECIYRPSQDGDEALVAVYEKLLVENREIETLVLDGGRAKRAAIQGGKLGLKLIDAIHYLSALEAGCDLFVTNDAQFKSGPKMSVIRIA